jgi:hypothetical protein
MEGDRITGVDDGHLSMGGHDLDDRVRPLTLQVKNCSELFAEYYNTLHQLQMNGLNFPDIHREMVRRWMECTDDVEKSVRSVKIISMRNWIERLRNRVRELKEETVDGVKLFR